MHFDPLIPSDLPAIPSLQPPEWYDICPVIEYYTHRLFCFPMKCTEGNKIIGIGAAIIHVETAWLAHIIVHPDHRGKGIGSAITRHLIDLCFEKNCSSIQLISTDLGAHVYEKLDFIIEDEYLFYKGLSPITSFTSTSQILPYTPEWLDPIRRLDKEISGEDRMNHMSEYLNSGFVFLNGGRVEGLYLPDWGEGMIIASTPIAGLELIKFRLHTKDAACFPSGNLEAAEFFRSHAFEPYRRAKRMRLGNAIPWQAVGIYNRVGGNLG